MLGCEQSLRQGKIVPELQRDDVPIHYETLGDHGPWVVLTPGGHSPLDDVLDLGRTIASAGTRVLLHDRRNCGTSGLWINPSSTEAEVWVDDVVALCDHLNIQRVIAGGGSAGCRLSLQLAIRHPDRVSALLLWWVTGGEVAARTLGHEYHGQYINVARNGGMEAVAKTPFFAERIAARPQNRGVLLGQSTEDFIDAMSTWQSWFLAGAELPVIGAAAEELAALSQPTCIVPGSDDVHPRQVAIRLQEIITDAELVYPFDRSELPAIKQLPPDEILVRFRERLSAIFIRFLTDKNFI